MVPPQRIRNNRAFGNGGFIDFMPELSFWIGAGVAMIFDRYGMKSPVGNAVTSHVGSADQGAKGGEGSPIRAIVGIDPV